LDPADLAELDRYAWGRAAGVSSLPAGIPVALYSEAVKFTAVANALRPVTEKLAGWAGVEPSIFDVDETSSPPSLKNIKAYIGGSLASLLAKGR